MIDQLRGRVIKGLLNCKDRVPGKKKGDENTRHSISYVRNELKSFLMQLPVSHTRFGAKQKPATGL